MGIKNHSWTPLYTTPQPLEQSRQGEIMNLRDAAQQALEALESLQGGCTDSDDGTVEAITVWCPEVIDALRTALTENKRDWSLLEATQESLREHMAGIQTLRAALAQPVSGEPVAWLEQVLLSSGAYSQPTKHWVVTQNPSTSQAPRKPLYTTPPQRQPLTDDRVLDIAEDFKSQYMHGGTTFDEFNALGFARAIEAAHGIKEQP